MHLLRNYMCAVDHFFLIYKLSFGNPILKFYIKESLTYRCKRIFGLNIDAFTEILYGLIKNLDVQIGTNSAFTDIVHLKCKCYTMKQNFRTP